MGAKRKFLISLSSLGVVVIMAITSIAVVFSALTANIDNRFSIFYTAKHINAAVAGSYNFSGTEKNMSFNGGNGVLTFQGNGESGGGILTL